MPPVQRPLNSRKSISSTSNYPPSAGSDVNQRNLRHTNTEKSGKSLFLTSKSAPASRTTSLISTAGDLKTQVVKRTTVEANSPQFKSRASTTGQLTNQSPPSTTTIVFDSDGRSSQTCRNVVAPKLITNLTSDRSWTTAKESLKCPVNSQLPKIKTPYVPLSETKGSYKVSSSSDSINLRKSGGIEKRSNTFPVVSLASGKKVVGNGQLSQCSQKSDVVRRCRSELVGNFIHANTCRESGEGNKKHESDTMKTARSELSLLEQKKLQWAKEKVELSGLWSPWGRQSETTDNRVSSSSVQMQASYPSPTNVVSSSYVANLGGPSPYSQSYSECYLPPINSTIAQQPRQRAKVWNAEFQQEDYKYENDNVSSSSQNSHRYSLSNVHRGSNVGVLHPRKASLPNYMYDSGENYHHNQNHNGHHQATHHEDEENINHQQQHAWGSSPIMDEEAFTSGYYSENNNNNSNNGDDGKKRKQEVVLKPTSRERTYQEEVTVEKAIAIRGEHNGSPRVIIHKIYSQNGEMFMEHDGNQEVIVNSMTVSLDEGSFSRNNINRGTPTASFGGDQQDSGRTGGRLPRNHAMRSSLTIGVDASSVDAYNELERREKQQWLNELEKQREEQRMRKMMEKEERRPRWGDRGIGVGHFWEPADSENSHLPAPPLTSRGKFTSSSSRGESCGDGIDMIGGSGDAFSPHSYHPVQSHTPPAWLERSLTRMQSSKSQPSLHDPDYVNDLDEINNGMSGEKSNQHLSSSRSLNHSTSDLMGYTSPTGDILDRTYLRGQNVPIDPDTLTEREKRRQANQEHLEALKKQIEAKQQQQREEKELRLQEEREQEMRMAKQREMELQRLEREKRGKMPVNGDMPNCVEDSTTDGPQNGHAKCTKNAAMMKSSNGHDAEEEKDIAIVQRQSVMVTATAPTVDDSDKTTESSDAVTVHHRPRLSRQDQSVMTDGSDPSFERTLTPSFQRSRSLSVSRANREFGTQTELSDGSSSSGSGSSCGSGKNSDKHRSHNSLLDKKEKEKKQQEKKPEERPRWGSNPIKKLYVKQSEKDPNYVNRMKRRQERLKRMEEERSVRADTGTESEDVSIPFHRIRQRRSDASPQRKVFSRGVTPMKATALQKTENSSRLTTASSTETVQQHQRIIDIKQESNSSKSKVKVISSRKGEGGPPDLLPSCPHSHAMKNAKSETHLNKMPPTTADIIDRNFGSVAGINVLSGTSEESSGFSTPFLPRRDLGSGSTESGTTGSGSGVQSPDLTYHTYQANKSTREERKYAKITSGRDTHSTSENFIKHSSSGNNSSNVDSSSKSVTTSTKSITSTAGKEFDSVSHTTITTAKGYIPQRDFDEMPVKAAQNTSILGNLGHLEEANSVIHHAAGASPSKKKGDHIKTSSPTRGRTMASNSNSSNASSPIRQQQRNKSMSPQRKPRSPVKVRNKELKNNNSRHHLAKSTNNISQASMKSHHLHEEEINLPNIPQDAHRLPSPPVPALLKKIQMGLQPDESGRISSLPKEFPDILAPLPTIPIGLLSPNPSRLSSATSVSGASSSAGKIDIDIAVTPRNNPEIVRLFEAAEERIKQRQLSAIMAGQNGKVDNDSGKSRTSFEADIGRISINLEPMMLFANNNDNGNLGSARVEEREAEAPNSGRRSTRSQSSSRPPRDAKIHEAFITSILNSKEVKEQLSARESELSEKGIIEFSIRLPSTSSGDELGDNNEYKDPLLTERRRHTAQWLYGGQNLPQKQAILTNLASLKKGIALQQQEWQVGPSDTE